MTISMDKQYRTRDGREVRIYNVMEWQPIETAPKDETILVYGNAKTGDQAEFGQTMAVAKYAMDYNFVNLGSRPLFIYAVGHETKIDKYIWPSHWMPLPEPPQ